MGASPSPFGGGGKKKSAKSKRSPIQVWADAPFVRENRDIQRYVLPLLEVVEPLERPEKKKPFGLDFPI